MVTCLCSHECRNAFNKPVLPATAPKYGVRGIPSLLIFNNGEVAGTKVGALSKSQLAAFIDSVI